MRQVSERHFSHTSGPRVSVSASWPPHDTVQGPHTSIRMTDNKERRRTGSLRGCTAPPPDALIELVWKRIEEGVDARKTLCMERGVCMRVDVSHPRSCSAGLCGPVS